jgi:hypothetical protein
MLIITQANSYSKPLAATAGFGLAPNGQSQRGQLPRQWLFAFLVVRLHCPGESLAGARYTHIHSSATLARSITRPVLQTAEEVSLCLSLLSPAFTSWSFSPF